MRVRKLRIKIFNEEKGKIEWIELCYIGSVLYKTFLEKMDISEEEFADYISDWFKKDFGLSINMTTKRDIAILKNTVRERYRTIFPVIYNNTDIDIQGWLRIWLSEKMEKELKNV